jgi:hypothetical protein
VCGCKTPYALVFEECGKPGSLLLGKSEKLKA